MQSDSSEASKLLFKQLEDQTAQLNNGQAKIERKRNKVRELKNVEASLRKTLEEKMSEAQANELLKQSEVEGRITQM